MVPLELSETSTSEFKIFGATPKTQYVLQGFTNLQVGTELYTPQVLGSVSLRKFMTKNIIPIYRVFNLLGRTSLIKKKNLTKPEFGQ